MTESVTISDDFNDIEHLFGKLGVPYNLAWDSISESQARKMIEGGEFVVVINDIPFGTTRVDWLDKKYDLDGNPMYNEGKAQFSNSTQLRESIISYVKGNGLKIPEKVEKWREAQQVEAGGNFDPDYNVDDIGDALAAIGGNTIKLVPVQKYQKQNSDTQENSQNAETSSKSFNKKKAALLALPVMGVGAAALWR